MKALILGGAECLWDDLRELGPWDGIIIATNDAGWAYPHRIEHWVTLHPEKLPYWMDKRGGEKTYLTWASKPHPAVDRGLDHWTGSSTGFAIRVACFLDADMIVLAGAPLTHTPHFLGGDPWKQYDTFREEWENDLLPRLDREGVRDRLYSMSGWTREILGAP